METLTPVHVSASREDFLALDDELEQAVLETLRSGNYVEDEQTAALEQEFAAFCGVRYAVGTASGTMAIVVALRALGIGPGDEVIAPAYTCTSTTSGISLAGASVRFADVLEDTMAIDPDRLEARLTPRTRAIMPVHIHGQVAEMNPLREIAERRDLLVVEDAALAVGARYRGQRTGGLGHAAAFSYAPGKVLGGIGWGGMVTTDDPLVAARARQIAGHGPAEPIEPSVDPREVETLAGYSAQMSGILAAGLRVKLRHVADWVERRRSFAAHLDEACDRLGIDRNHPQPWVEPSYRAYVVRHRRREALQSSLEQAGIRAYPYYDPPLHLRPIHAHLGNALGDFPVAEKAAGDHLCLPVHPHLTEEALGRIISALETAL